MQGEFNECATLAPRAIRSVLGFENWYNRILGVCIGWNMIKIFPAFLMMSSVAMASEPTQPIAAPVIPVHGQKLNPSPCELLKKVTVKKDKNGREIITTETSADCRYDSNKVKKQKEFE